MAGRDRGRIRPPSSRSHVSDQISVYSFSDEVSSGCWCFGRRKKVKPTIPTIRPPTPKPRQSSISSSSSNLPGRQSPFTNHAPLPNPYQSQSGYTDFPAAPPPTALEPKGPVIARSVDDTPEDGKQLRDSKVYVLPIMTPPLPTLSAPGTNVKSSGIKGAPPSYQQSHAGSSRPQQQVTGPHGR